MKIAVDTHTHSIASGHAYSTIDELAKGARKSRLKGFVLTEHGPALQGGAPHPYYFANLRVLPEKLHGVRLFHGVELNVIDDEGGVDLLPRYVRHLDFVMCGLHESCFPPRDLAENTKALLAIIANPLVDAIAHPGNPAYPVDIEEVVKTAVRYRKALEINNSSFLVSRRGSEANCRKVAELSCKYGALLVCGTDAHYWRSVGNFKEALSIINDAHIHPDQVINSSYNKFIEFIERRKMERRAVG
ncbi:MAG: phosphatase [Spirochaetaceae bacterium]|jgi:putative hydrolase|nr:phosphatase [Spirochaetaceae bacterium]